MVPLLALALSRLLYAQDIAGDWPGTIRTGAGLRVVLHVDKGNAGRLSATLFSIDQTTDGLPVTSITLQGSELVFSLDGIHVSYRGKLDAAATHLTGQLTQGNEFPLNLERATKATAWTRDPTPHNISYVSV